MELIHPFHASKDIAWNEVKLDRRKIPIIGDREYVDDRLRLAQRYFLHRDLSLLPMCIIYCVASIMFARASYYFGLELNILQQVVGLAVGIIAVVDIVVHYKQASATGDTIHSLSALRRVLQVSMATLIPLLGSATPFLSQHNCEGLKQIGEGLLFNTPPITPYRSLVECKQIINPFILINPAALMVLYSLPLRFMFPIYVLLCFIDFILAPVILWPGLQDTDITVAIRIVVYLVASYLAMLFIRQRDRDSDRQYQQAVAVMKETQAADQREVQVTALLVAMMPMSALRRLTVGQPVTDFSPSASVLFSDMESFTGWSSHRSAAQVSEMLNTLVIQFDALTQKCSVEKVKTVGDAYWVVAGLPDNNDEHACSICDFGQAMLGVIDGLNEQHPEWSGIRWRVGINSGPLQGGILGTLRLGYEVYGETSDIAISAELCSPPARVSITDATLNLLNLPDFIIEALQIVDGEHNDKPLKLYVLPRGRAIYELQHDPDSMSQGASLGRQSPALMDAGRVSPEVLARSVSPVPSLEVIHLDDDERSEVQSFLHERVRNRNAASPSSQKSRSDIQNTPSPPDAQPQHGEEDGVSPRETDTMPLEEIEAKYTKRKWSWFFLDFADRDVEMSYRYWTKHLQMPMRRLSRIGVLAFLLLIPACVVIQDGVFSGIDLICFLIGLCTSITDLVLTYRARYDGGTVSSLTVQIVLHHISAIALLVGACFVPKASSVATNDPTYLHAIVTLYLSFGNLGLASAFGIIVTNIVFLVIPTALLTANNILYGLHSNYLILAVIIMFSTIYIMERRYRRQFLDYRVAQHFRDKQEQRNEEQRAVLEAIVPNHAIEPLMHWFQAGMKREETVSNTYDCVCVAFVELLPRDANNPVPAEDWLGAAHTAVDEIIKQDKYSAVDKIKTIGSIVMLAGPFEVRHCTLREATVQMIGMINDFRNVTPLRAGIHCGELVGAVLGSNRLCFDIFGDTVNVASRAMSTGSRGEVSVTREFFGEFPENTRIGDSTIVFSDETTRSAKGKGHIRIRTLL